jgi:hypothetical protein
MGLSTEPIVVDGVILDVGKTALPTMSCSMSKSLAAALRKPTTAAPLFNSSGKRVPASAKFLLLHLV